MRSLPAIRVSRFVAEDAMAIPLHAAQLDELAWYERQQAARGWEAAGNAFTVRDAARSARILCCAGAIERHPGHASLWGLYAEGLRGPEWLVLAQRTAEFIAGLPHRRVDAAVVAQALPARRWAARVGLEFEAIMQSAAPDGSDLAVYRRIKG